MCHVTLKKNLPDNHRFCEYKNQIPRHSPTEQISVSEHFSVDPQKQTFDTQESESPVQSALLSQSIIIQFWRANKPRVDLNSDAN